MIIVSFPHNPTTATVGIEFFERLVAFAKERGILLVHDMAYADLVFDAERAPSMLQVPGAKDVGVELFSMSKSYSMPGWRLAFLWLRQPHLSVRARSRSWAMPPR